MITLEQLQQVRDHAMMLYRDELSSDRLRQRATAIVDLVQDYRAVCDELEETRQALKDTLDTIDDVLHGRTWT